MNFKEIVEGYKVLPAISDRYQKRDGLEGPFMTGAGKVVYYDPKEGSYYDPDTDMYMSYEEYKALDEGRMGYSDAEKLGGDAASKIDNALRMKINAMGKDIRDIEPGTLDQMRYDIAKQMGLIKEDFDKDHPDFPKAQAFQSEKDQVADILKKYPEETKKMQQDGDVYSIYAGDLYMALMDYYADEMPYGVQKARDGDPIEWLNTELDDLGLLDLNENARRKLPGVDPADGPMVPPVPMDVPVRGKPATSMPIKNKDDYNAKKKALQDIMMDPNTSKDEMLKREIMKRKAELDADALRQGLKEADNTIYTPDEIIKIITDTLAESDPETLASYCKSILMGDCEVAPDGENIMWDPGDFNDMKYKSKKFNENEEAKPKEKVWKVDKKIKLANDSIWMDRAEKPIKDEVHVLGVLCEYDPEEGYIDCYVAHDGPWNIYTDSGFAKEISKITGHNLSWSEQGMQAIGQAHLEGNKGVEEVKEDVGSPKERIVKVLDTIFNDYYEKGYATEHEHFKLGNALADLESAGNPESSHSAILDFYGSMDDPDDVDEYKYDFNLLKMAMTQAKNLSESKRQPALGLITITEKSKKPKPTKPDKWAYAKAQAKKKFDVYPSAYANAWAAKKYKELGGGWR